MDNEEFLPEWYWANKRQISNPNVASQLIQGIIVVFLVLVTFGLVLIFGQLGNAVKGNKQ